MVHRTGRIVFINSSGLEGKLIDLTYPERCYSFKSNKGDYEPNQVVIYHIEEINPITSYRFCTIIAPKLYPGLQPECPVVVASNKIKNN